MALPLKKKTVTERKKVETTKKDSAYIIQKSENGEKKQGLNENELFVAKNCCITIESVLGRKTCEAESLSKCLYGARNMEELA